LLDRAHKEGEKKASPGLKIFRTDARSRPGNFLIIAKDFQAADCHANDG
jgi:hypothetical protein